MHQATLIIRLLSSLHFFRCKPITRTFELKYHYVIQHDALLCYSRANDSIKKKNVLIYLFFYIKNNEIQNAPVGWNRWYMVEVEDGG